MSHSQKQTIFLMHYGGDQIRGSEICLFHSIDALLEADYRVVLFRNNPIIDTALPKNEALTIVDFAYHEIMIDGNISLPFIGYLGAVKHLYNHIKQYKPQAIFCNSGLPCQTALPAGKLTNTKVLCHFHHPATKRYFYLWLVKYVDKLIYPSRYTRNHVKNKCGREGSVIYNAIDLETTYQASPKQSNALRLSLNIKDETVVIGQIAALVPHKRPDLLMRCFAKLHQSTPDIHLIIIGKGEMHQELVTLRSELKLDSKVTITGYVADTLPYLQHVIDINVLASTEEGLGISVIEAAGCERASVVTDCTGLSEVVEHEVTGLKFAENDKQALISSIQRLVTDPELRVKYGKAARAKALTTFNLKNYKESIISSIQSL